MGMRFFGSSSRRESNTPYPTDPDPKSFQIRSLISGNGFVLAEIAYPNCTNFEGNKLLLFYGVTENWVRRQCEIDPHFSKDGKIVARFVPTLDGYKLARKFLI